MNYNLPPWLSVKKGFLLLSLIIPGPSKVKNLDTYLALVVNEFKTLWDGVWAYDGRKTTGGIPGVFRLKASACGQCMIILVRNHAHASIYFFIILFCDYLLF
jgi:hypothetical protein